MTTRGESFKRIREINERRARSSKPLRVECVRYIPLIGSPAVMPVERARFELEREDALYLAMSATHRIRPPEIQWSTKTIWAMSQSELDAWLRPVRAAKEITNP